MKAHNKGKPLLIAACFLLLVAVAAASVYIGFIIPIQNEISDIEKNISATDSFLNSQSDDSFKNAAAIKGFESSAPAENEEYGTVCSFKSPEGIKFISKSDKWDTTKLEALYNELLQNKHGDEINTLTKVIVNPQADQFASATHQNISETTVFSLDFPAIPDNFNICLSRDAGIINLYGGDTNDTVESMASSLSHEYGHHYTFAHMFSDSSESQLNSKYAALRGFTSDNVMTDISDTQFYYDNHYRYLVEIAAEDYVTLMGSPTSRRDADYYDIMDSLNGKENPSFVGRSALVQENFQLPIASSVNGLADYFYSFTNEAEPKFQTETDMHINIEKQTKSYNLVEGYREFTSYTITWNKIYGDSATYVLVCYDEDDLKNTFLPIKTIHPGEEARAYIGQVTQENGNSISWADDNIIGSTKVLAVAAVLDDNTMYISDKVDYSF